MSLSLTMTLHILCGKWWPILCPPSGALLHWQKGWHHRTSMQPSACIDLSSVIHQVTPSYSFSQGFTWYWHQIWGIKLVVLWLLLRVRHSSPWLEVHVRAYLFSYWLISFTLGYQEGEKQRTLQNITLLYKINESVMETLVFYAKEKRLCHKTLTFPVFSYYMCVHIFIMNLHVNGLCICIFMFYL